MMSPPTKTGAKQKMTSKAYLTYLGHYYTILRHFTTSNTEKTNMLTFQLMR